MLDLLFCRSIRLAGPAASEVLTLCGELAEILRPTLRNCSAAHFTERDSSGILGSWDRRHGLLLRHSGKIQQALAVCQSRLQVLKTHDRILTPIAPFCSAYTTARARPAHIECAFLDEDEVLPPRRYEYCRSLAGSE